MLGVEFGIVWVAGTSSASRAQSSGAGASAKAVRVRDVVEPDRTRLMVVPASASTGASEPPVSLA